MTWANWDFLTRLRDRRVLRFMEEQRLELYVEREHISRLVPIPTALIAQRCNRSIGSTTGILLRLEQRGKVYEASDGAWLPGERPQKTPPWS
jgi:hypothetical protein